MEEEKTTHPYCLQCMAETDLIYHLFVRLDFCDALNLRGVCKSLCGAVHGFMGPLTGPPIITRAKDIMCWDVGVCTKGTKNISRSGAVGSTGMVAKRIWGPYCGCCNECSASMIRRDLAMRAEYQELWHLLAGPNSSFIHLHWHASSRWRAESFKARKVFGMVPPIENRAIESSVDDKKKERQVQARSALRRAREERQKYINSNNE